MSVVPEPLYFNRASSATMPGLGAYATAWVRGHLYVLRSLATMSNGSKYCHVSVSTKNRHPTWEEMVLVRDQFIGLDTEAVLVLPPKVFHVNVHAHCFHWWSRVNGPETSELPGLHKIIHEEAL